jgi:TonB family protein
MLLAVMVHPADVQDRDGAEPLLRQARRLFPFVERLIGDAGYQGPKMAAAVARTVVLRVLIGPDGGTVGVRIHRSSGAVLLDRAAVEAVERWAFRPAIVGGCAVPAWVEVPVQFRLK